jgi:hypothetical protein
VLASFVEDEDGLTWVDWDGCKQNRGFLTLKKLSIVRGSVEALAKELSWRFQIGILSIRQHWKGGCWHDDSIMRLPAVWLTGGEYQDQDLTVGANHA